MNNIPVTKKQLIQQLRALGVRRGGVLLVHTAFSKVGPVEDGPAGLIDALRSILGPAGTLVMPSMSWDDDRLFDPQTTPCPHMGIVAETFWRTTGVLRSDNHSAFAAAGPHARLITAPTQLIPPHGLNSPVGRVYELDGQLLLLGVGHDANTTIHLAEYLAGVRYRRDKTVMIQKDGQAVRFAYQEIDHCCQKFALVDGWLKEHQLQQIGPIGHAAARLVKSRAVVQVVTDQLRLNETSFLHPPGVDEECDDAWRSLGGTPK